MIWYLTFPPLTVILGQWEHPVDPFNSTGRRILKDKLRQVRVSPGKKKDTYEFSLQRRDSVDSYIPIKENLWRAKLSFSDWQVGVSLTLKENFDKFVFQGMEFISEIIPVTESQVKIGVYYNESRNVSAATIGYGLHKISAIQIGDYTKD